MEVVEKKKQCSLIREKEEDINNKNRSVLSNTDLAFKESCWNGLLHISTLLDAEGLCIP